jgi:seryl-tRNA(Sec) selenium transferase
MIAVLGERPGRIPLEEVSAMGRKAGVPVLVDAAAEVPSLPNSYIQRGADMVAISGGKYLAGPQCSGILLGRRDLVQAAWISSAPHHGLCRTMKVGKEEIMGLLAAVETFVRERSYQKDLEVWNSWLSTIQESVLAVPGVRAALHPPDSPNPHPYLLIEWSHDEIPVTGGELNQRLLDGNPRIMTLASGDRCSFRARAGGMKPGDDKLVAGRLKEVFAAARREKGKAPAAPAEDVSGRWDVEVRFIAGAARHTFELQAAGNRVTGTHRGEYKKGDVAGTIDGDRLRLRSQLPCDGFALPYLFTGSVYGDRMSGQLNLGEHGRARWTAQRA